MLMLEEKTVDTWKRRIGLRSMTCLLYTSLTLLSLPTLLWYLIFSYLPMFGVVIAFKEYKLAPGGHAFLYNLFASDWAGFKNFKYFFTSNSFFMLLRNTILYNIAFIRCV